MHWLKGNYLLLTKKFQISKTFYYSYKFHRLFPLSQYDLPSHNSKILTFPRPYLSKPPQSLDTSAESSSTLIDNQPDLIPPRITQDQISQNNPDVDYTRLVICFVAVAYRFRHIIVLLDPISFRLYFRMWAVWRRRVSVNTLLECLQDDFNWKIDNEQLCQVHALRLVRNLMSDLKMDGLVWYHDNLFFPTQISMQATLISSCS